MLARKRTDGISKPIIHPWIIENLREIPANPIDKSFLVLFLEKEQIVRMYLSKSEQRAEARRSKRALSHISIRNNLVVGFTEKKRDTPNARKGDQGIDNARDERVGAAAYPRDDIELKETYATPVKRADNGEDQRNFINNHKRPPTLPPKNGGKTCQYIFTEIFPSYIFFTATQANIRKIKSNKFCQFY